MHEKLLSLFVWLVTAMPILAEPYYTAIEKSMQLQEKLNQAYLAKGAGYRPRTEHFNEDGTPKYINRLILEDSPYLLQHAHNPVDWHPWSDEAFERAKQESKPIFLSIGYSTCHWCHVMERESFEDPTIAAILKEHFIAIKVDRESHPDVDQIYMSAVMLLAGHGGWPMSSFLTPEGKPFFGGTYYRPEQFSSLLKQVAKVWVEQRQEVEAQASRVADAVAQNNRLSDGSQNFDPALVSVAVSTMAQIFDELQGGFGQAPKFPHEPLLFLLLDQAERRNDAKALEMLTTTLDHMMHGGIYDQVGGGFHRYATDYEWLVPHFEKMLYNQAHLSRVYLGAWRLTGRERYRRVAIQTLDYVLREMTAPQGGFYSATDADSEGEEGLFFTWTLREIRDALTPEDAELAKSLYSVSRLGNFEGRSILHLERSLEDHAAQQKMDLDELRQRLDRINGILLRVRNQRIAPLRDDKRVTAWNGMMITAFAEAADLLDSDTYRQAAQAAAEFLWRQNRRGPGQFWRVHLDGRSSVEATLEDYAYFAEALLALYDLAGERHWLERAGELADALLERFLDRKGGGFYLNETQAGITAMGRPKDDGSDDAIPSGTSVALRVLQGLWRRTGNLTYQQQTEALIKRFAATLARQPHGHSYMLSAITSHREGELRSHAYAAQGGIRLNGKVSPHTAQSMRLTVTLDIPSGWHINSDQPGNDQLIATQLHLANGASGWELGPVAYPEGEQQYLAFQKNPVSLYSGLVRLEASVRPTAATATHSPLSLGVRLQACNEKVCLPPETAVLRIPVR
ncbi:MAG: thioredoxin domain-containing protein [Chromatiales bacterium]